MWLKNDYRKGSWQIFKGQRHARGYGEEWFLSTLDIGLQWEIIKHQQNTSKTQHVQWEDRTNEVLLPKPAIDILMKESFQVTTKK